MKRRRQPLQVSTFPFLAVLLAAMGSLILLLLVFDRQAKVVARKKALLAAAQASEEHRQRAAARQAELERRRLELEQFLARQRDEAAAELRTARSKLDTAMRDLGAEAARQRELHQRVADLRAALLLLEKDAKAHQEKAGATARADKQALAALAREAGELEHLERTLKDLREARRRQRETWSLVPYRGKRGDSRRPLYLECTATGVIFHPDQLHLEGPQFSLPAVRAEVQQRMERQRHDVASAKEMGGGGHDRSAYLLMLVRPDGIANYYRTMTALTGVKVDFGYEFIDAEWILDFPDDNSERTQPWMVAQPGGNASRAGPGTGSGTGGGLRDRGTPGSSNAGRHGATESGDGANGLPLPRGVGQGPGVGGPLPGEAAARPGTQGRTASGQGGAGAGTSSAGVASPGGPAGGLLRPGGAANGGAGAGGMAGPLAQGAAGAEKGGTGNRGPSGAVGTQGGECGTAGGVPLPGVGGSVGKTGTAAGLVWRPGAGGGASADAGTAPGVSGLPGSGAVGEGPAQVGPPPILRPLLPEFRPGARTSAGVTNPGAGQRDSAAKEQPRAPDAAGPPGASVDGQGRAAPGKPGAAEDVRPRGPAPAADREPDPNARPLPRLLQAPPGEGGGQSAPPALGGTAIGIRRPPLPPLSRVLGNRDWMILIECRANEVIVKPWGYRFPVAAGAPHASEHPLVQKVRELIARRQATVRAGEAPYRPLLRFQVRPDGLRSYYFAYPLLDALRIPMSRENLEDLPR